MTVTFPEIPAPVTTSPANMVREELPSTTKFLVPDIAPFTLAVLFTKGLDSVMVPKSPYIGCPSTWVSEKVNPFLENISAKTGRSTTTFTAACLLVLGDPGKLPLIGALQPLASDTSK